MRIFLAHAYFYPVPHKNVDFFFYFANSVALLGSSRKAIGLEFQLRLTQEIEMQYNNIIPLT